MNKLIIDEKIINKINRDENSYNVSIEWINEKGRSFPVSSNDFPAASVVTSSTVSLGWKRPKIINQSTPKKASKLEKQKFVLTQCLKKMKVTHWRITFFNNLHIDIADMINRKMESSLEKIQSIYN